MTTTSRAGGHASDGELVMLLDDEQIPDDRSIRAHVAVCAACTDRLDELGRQSGMFGEMLASTPTPPPDTATERSRLLDRLAQRRVRPAVTRLPLARAAAGILVAAGIAAATPLGDIVTNAARSVLAPRSETTSAPAAPSVAETHTPTAGTLIRFASNGDTLVVRFAAVPAEGSLTMTQGGSAQVSAQITGNAASEEFVILPGALHIRNTVASRAGYEVVLPVRVTAVVVAGVDTLFVGLAASAPRPLPLGRGGPAGPQ